MRRLSLVLALAAPVACTTGIHDTGDLTAPSLARAAGNLDLDSHATWTFYSTLSDGTTPTGIYGDSRGLDGGPSGVAGESTYPGETCGVRGKLFNSAAAGNSSDAPNPPRIAQKTMMAVRFWASVIARAPIA